MTVMMQEAAHSSSVNCAFVNVWMFQSPAKPLGLGQPQNKLRTRRLCLAGLSISESKKIQFQAKSTQKDPGSEAC